MGCAWLQGAVGRARARPRGWTLPPPPQPRNPADQQPSGSEERAATRKMKNVAYRGPGVTDRLCGSFLRIRGSLRPPVPSHTEPPRTGDGARGRIPRRHRNPRVNRGTPFQVELPELSNAALPAVRAPAMCHQRGGGRAKQLSLGKRESYTALATSQTQREMKTASDTKPGVDSDPGRRGRGCRPC